MPGFRDQRHAQQRSGSISHWTAWGGDPATARPPDRQPAPPPAWPTPTRPPTRRGGTRCRARRRAHPLNFLLFRPLRLIVFAYVRAMLRAVIPWLLPLGILAVLSRLGIYLSTH